MNIGKPEFAQYIRNFNFKELFNDLGWNNDKTSQPIVVDNITFILQAVAEKRGFKILLCNPSSSGHIPDYTFRRKIETKVTKLFQEHLIIFHDAKKQEQIWQLVVRQSGKPTKVTETRYNISQDPQLLYQRASGLFFELDEEEKITIVDVTRRVSDNFHQNNEKVTKQFYERFKKEHTAFLAFIKGIEDKISDKVNQQKQWYASLMLNRLMFCYFIQKKGFLDNNKNYLRVKLNACQEKKGKDEFYSFYRDFLLVLFHHGLNEVQQKDEIKIEIGKIPYLNGGLFDVHELELAYKNIDISDKAFEKLFDFFDQYEWHLDSSINATGKDINPDVIGYIFEKYINDRNQMGAYYTKEDITEYISKNCVIPYLFDETKRQYPKAFNNDSEIWQLFIKRGTDYIYDSVKHGVEEMLPSEISVGITDLSKRAEWNKPAPDNFALSTEIWREVIDRRNRHNEIKSKIENGDIKSITDFTTYNLNIRQFAQDVIESTNDPDFLKAFYKSLKNITIIDPTCGSGAFLFAAMNILESLYEATIQRMEIFINESHKGKYKFFEETLQFVKAPEHPNLQYFIYKTIILQNLYGVDIMKEAVEIAKLRLFLKLVATVDADINKPNLGLEPLPDIDFNIRAGNTLIGFASLNEAIKAVNDKDKSGQMGLVFEDEIDIVNSINDKADDLSHVFKSFKNAQLRDNLVSFKEAKAKLIGFQSDLNEILNEYLAYTYGIDKSKNHKAFLEWFNSHQPFHWFAEFYEIIHDKGGFDCVIGNPPYVEYSKVSNHYKIMNYQTLECGNLHAFCLERALQIKRNIGFLGFIVPLAIISTPRMESGIKLIKKTSDAYFSSYECRPAKLFEGADIRLSIVLLCPLKNSKFHFHSTKLIKFSSTERDTIFQTLSYTDLSKIKFDFNLIPKISNNIELNIYNTLFSAKDKVSNFVSENLTKHRIYYSYGFRYWAKILNNPTYFQSVNASKSTGEKELQIISESNVSLIGLALSSSLFYWYYVVTSDAHNFTKHIINNFPIEAYHDEKQEKLFSKYQKDLEVNSIVKTVNYKSTGTIRYREYYVKKSKLIIDEIDRLLSEQYGLSEEELDFITNYDIKYRMGKELEDE